MALVVTKLRTNDTGPAVTALHNSLAVLGATVSATETARSTLGQTTVAAVVAFRTRYGLPQVSRTAPIVDASTNALIQVAATFAASADRTALKSSVTDALKSADSSQPQVLYWLARYSILAGDYATANSIARRIPSLEEVITVVNPLFTLGEPHPRQSELPHPENFYTYREDLVDPATLGQMVSGMASMTKEQYAADLSTPGHTFSPDNIEQFRLDAATSQGRPALAAIAAWQTGNHQAANREFRLVLDSYAKCQSAVADYLDKFFGVPTQGTAQERLQSLLRWMSQGPLQESLTWNELRWRRILLSLQELEEQDRDKLLGTDGAFTSAGNFVTAFLYMTNDVGTSVAAQNQSQRLNTFMFVLGTIWVPLARGEVNCQLRQFETAIQEFADIKTSQEKLDPNFRYMCEFIEVPFIRLQTVETLLNKADAQYKAGSTAEAQATYESVLSLISDDGNYVARVREGRDNLAALIQQPLQSNDTTSRSFQTLGKSITVSTIVPTTRTLPGMDRTLDPHQSIVTIVSPDGLAMRETNPRVYAMALTATAKLEQIKAGFNYLGFPDDYVPPWRFQFLLDRARYFTEHAKNAERDYLNFLNNAEHEEFQELSASQNVEMEKSNVNIETAKVDQARLEVKASSESQTLADLNAQHKRRGHLCSIV